MKHDWSSLFKIGPITPEQRRWIAEHERLHLEMAARHNQFTRGEMMIAHAQINAFEAGEVPGETVELSPKRKRWDAAVDLAINSVLRDMGYKV